MRKLFVVAGLLLVLPCVLVAQPNGNFITISRPEEAGMSKERLERIDAMLNDYIAKQQVPGVVALIVRDGKIVYHKSFGYRDIEAKTPLKKDDIFRIASMSKAVASLAIMMLFEEGKFLLDDPVSNYIPEFKSPKVLKTFEPKDSSFTTEPARGEITIRHLLTHTSGLDYAAIGSNEFKSIYAKASIPSGIGTDKYVLADRIKVLGGLPLKHHPGERWTYGLNTDVLGYLVEVLSGMTFDQFLKTRVFEPLGMKDSYFYLPKEKHGRLVTLHETKDGKAVVLKTTAYDEVDPEYPKLAGKYFSGGAGLSSTTEDYARFLQLFLNKGVFNGKRLLSRKTVELMLTDQLAENVSAGNEFGLGFGLETEENDGQSILSKGSFRWGGAFNTHYWADPQEKLIGILYTNIYNTPYWSIGERFKTLTYQSIAD
jgi:CubicO group peptidase (beta-lactamase class C family)